MVGAVGVVELLEGLAQVGVGLALEVEVEALVEGQVEMATGFVGCLPVERLRIADEVEGIAQVLRPGGQLSAGVEQGLGDAVTFGSDGGQARADLVARDGGLFDHVEQSFFFDVEPRLLGAQALVGAFGHLPLVLQRLGDARVKEVDEVLGQLQGGVVVADLVFDEPDRQVAQVAGAVLGAPAFEVLVEGAVVVLSFGVDQPGQPTSLVAAVAEEHALEVVVVDAAAGVALSAGVQDVLDPVVEVLGDDGLVPTVVDDSLEVDLAEVVDIAEHLGELVLGHRLGGAPGRCPGKQAAVGHDF